MANANGGIIGKYNVPVDNGQAEIITTYNSSGTHTTAALTTAVSYLVIAGGGGAAVNQLSTVEQRELKTILGDMTVALFSVAALSYVDLADAAMLSMGFPSSSSSLLEGNNAFSNSQTVSYFSFTILFNSVVFDTKFLIVSI